MSAPLTQALHWHRVADVMPDADITVLMWTRGQDGTHDWCSGGWDGTQWFDSTGWHWAQPEGPQE